MVYFPNVHNGQDCAMLKSGARSSAFPMGGGGPKYLGHLSLLSPGHKQGAGAGVELLGHELRPIQDASVACAA